MTKITVERRLQKLEEKNRSGKKPLPLITVREVRAGEGDPQYTTLQNAQQAWEQLHPDLLPVVHLNICDPSRDARPVVGYSVVME